MPETTIYMTCGVTGEPVQLRLTPGGDVKTALLDEEGKPVETADKEK
jgi:hypothetical protein